MVPAASNSSGLQKRLLPLHDLRPRWLVDLYQPSCLCVAFERQPDDMNYKARQAAKHETRWLGIGRAIRRYSDGSMQRSAEPNVNLYASQPAARSGPSDRIKQCLMHDNPSFLVHNLSRLLHLVNMSQGCWKHPVGGICRTRHVCPDLGREHDGHSERPVRSCSPVRMNCIFDDCAPILISSSLCTAKANDNQM